MGVKRPGMAKWSRGDRRALFHYQRAQGYGSDTAYSPAEWAVLLDWFGGVCLCCGATEGLTVDHVVPLSQGGGNTIRNVQPLCRSCNARKKERTIDYRDARRLVQVLAMLEGGS